MEKSKRQQHFQEQFAALDAELRSLPGAEGQQEEVAKQTNRQRKLELQYKLGQLCTDHSERKLACLYFQRLLDDLKQQDKSSEPSTQNEDELLFRTEMLTLRVNALNCLSALKFQSGDQTNAMELLLEAKQSARERPDITGIAQLEKPLAANYTLFLHAKGNVHDAIQIALSIIEPNSGNDEGATDPTEYAARSTAYLC